MIVGMPLSSSTTFQRRNALVTHLAENERSVDSPKQLAASLDAESLQQICVKLESRPLEESKSFYKDFLKSR